MSIARTELYKAVAIQSWGVPYALISSQVSPDHSEAVATAVALRLTQENQFELLDKQVVSTDLSQPDLAKLVVDDADAIDMLFDHALDFCQLHVNEAWVGAYQKAPPPHASIPELRPHPLGSWQRGLIQMRLRGLSDAILKEMEQVFVADEVRTVLFELQRSVKPRTFHRRS